ncbi:glycosyltransferase family 2 protein [Humisphaera borealis]|uniref:Glycosyltransferase family 2 protein n=1 Tax=Humisphaera borealis TaxID=2807512 RepID=A0A7M2WYI7_9BACT|nr:glycosyltransferase family 2 protein [Humisphaera borealis]QOV90473.1 glycosyltransferase family 2 protein [Humisphaera borealis]
MATEEHLDTQNRSTSTEQPISVVVPCFNEKDVIRVTHQRLSSTLSEIGHAFEIIYVDDGSRDTTLEILREMQLADSNVRVVALSRNFGHQVAVTAGVSNARGEAVILIDADLQDPPEVIVEMVRLWRTGVDVAYGQRTDRPGETAFKRFTAKLFYRLINRMSDVSIPVDTGDFRLMSRRVVDALLSMPERDRFVRGMVSWVGFRQVAVPYRREPRFAGESKYPILKMVRFATDGLLSFSLTPLRVSTGIGFAAAVLAAFGILYALILRLFTNVWVSGWTLLFIAVLFFSGVQLLSVGIIGEYLGRVYREVKRRPLFLVGERLGFDPDSHANTSRQATVASRQEHAIDTRQS